MKHFYQREIGSETIGQFVLKLDEKFNLIMPYYNLLYNQKIKELDMLLTIDVKTENSLEKTGTIKNEGNTKAETSANSKNINKYSDTPQGTLVNVENESYLTDLRINEDNSGGETKSENANNEIIDTMDKFIERRYGYDGLNPLDQLQKMQNMFFDIDYMILNKCEDLFLKLW